MNSLNYHHLRYFWAVARSGNLTRAATEFHLTPQTVSAQIKDLEEALGERLFRRSGRRLELTDVGELVFRYADEIFSIGKELVESLAGQPIGRPMRLVVGVADVLPKLVAHRLLAPAMTLDEPVRIVCRETGLETLLGDLAIHRVDVVLSDAPIPPSIKIQAYNHLLGECGVTFMASSRLAKRYRRKFPACLDGAPVLLPTEGTALRSQLDQWFRKIGVRPKIVAEFEDSALLKTFGQAGDGVFPVPSIVVVEVGRQYQVTTVGVAEGVNERFYAITVERRIVHPAVVAICAAARTELF